MSRVNDNILKIHVHLYPTYDVDQSAACMCITFVYAPLIRAHWAVLIS